MTEHHDEAEAYRNRAERAEQEAAELRDLAERLAEALEECASDIEAEVESRRGTVLSRTTERDLMPVHRARAALTAYAAHMIR